MHWLTRMWWGYLLETPRGSEDYGVSTLRKIWCRAKGHEDVVWYSSTRLEPDMTCTGCGDYIG